MLEKESNLNTNKVFITIKKVKDSYTREEVDRLLDEQASKTTAEMLEKFKGYKSREEVIRLLRDVHLDIVDGNYSKGLNKWIKANL